MHSDPETTTPNRSHDPFQRLDWIAMLIFKARPQRDFKGLIWESPELVVQSFELGNGEFLLGRDPAECACAIAHPTVSRQHLRLIVNGSDIQFEDLNSRNGSLLNGIPCSSGCLQSGDILTLGTLPVGFINLAELDLLFGDY